MNGTARRKSGGVPEPIAAAIDAVTAERPDLLKILVVLICVAAILQRLLPALGVGGLL